MSITCVSLTLCSKSCIFTAPRRLRSSIATDKRIYRILPPRFSKSKWLTLSTLATGSYPTWWKVSFSSSNWLTQVFQSQSTQRISLTECEPLKMISKTWMKTKSLRTLWQERTLPRHSRSFTNATWPNSSTSFAKAMQRCCIWVASVANREY